MHIIPVIDVRHGIAVRAVAGDRANYRPLMTPLASAEGACGNLTALDLARGYRNLQPFPTVYVADLDAIEGRGGDSDLAETLNAALPDVAVWIDAGLRQPAPGGSITSVIGSEALVDADLRPIPDHAVLSLDFRGDDFIGPQALLARPELWPQRVIVMTLARVGADGGPDLKRIAEIAQRAPSSSQIYAAGGIRDVGDLHAAHAAGAHGALIASALHAQKIKADDLREIIGL